MRYPGLSWPELGKLANWIDQQSWWQDEYLLKIALALTVRVLLLANRLLFDKLREVEQLPLIVQADVIKPVCQPANIEGEAVVAPGNPDAVFQHRAVTPFSKPRSTMSRGLPIPDKLIL